MSSTAGAVPGVERTTSRPGRRSLARRLSDSPRVAMAWHYSSTVALVAVFVLFAAAHLRAWEKTGAPTGLGLVFQEGLAAILFLVRRPPRRTSLKPFDWLMALGGSWLVLACRPVRHSVLGLDAPYNALQLLGVALAVFSLSALGRSFGVVAADRGLKTRGPYACVRHPIYAAYLITEAAYLLQNPSVWNLIVTLLANACQLARIFAEERVLSRDPGYRAYTARVRYRLVPGLF